MGMNISDDKMLDLLSGINAQLTSLNGNMTVVLEKLSSHELRLTKLEENKIGLKDSIIALICKALVISTITVASLTGAGTLLKQIWVAGDFNKNSQMEIQK